MIQGKEKTIGEKKLYVGLTTTEVKSFNPSKAELNRLLGVEAKEDDKEVIYSSQDQEGNERQRMAFWLFDEGLNKYFVHSFLLTKKDRVNKDETKVQIINSTCDTTWVPFKKELDEDGNETGKLTNEADADLVPVWFKNFTKKDDKTKELVTLGPKTWRKAVSGEEELGTFLKAWLGKLNWRDPETANVDIDTDQLFKEKYGEIRELIDGNFATPFVALVGVRTDPDDKTKKYQQIWSKMFLPNGFMKFVRNGFVFPADKDGKKNFNRKIWEDFEKEVNGEYGPGFYVDLAPIHEYDETQDITASSETKRPPVAANSSEY